MIHNDSESLSRSKTMSYKIQITVDEQLNNSIKKSAKKMGLSISSYARLALVSALTSKESNLLNQAIKDIHSNSVETLSLSEFNSQIDKL
jgi:hypothetical protein